MLAAGCSERCPTAVADQAGPGIIAMVSGDTVTPTIPTTIPVTVATTVATTGSSTATSAAAPVRERRNRCQGSNR